MKHYCDNDEQQLQPGAGGGTNEQESRTTRTDGFCSATGALNIAHRARDTVDTTAKVRSSGKGK